MSLADWHRRVVADDDWQTAPVRGALHVLTAGYQFAVRRRNDRFDRRGPTVTLDKPTISVGNITVGGTGKTPLVIDLLHRLTHRGCRPAVLARGYGGRAGAANDEEQLIRSRCPGVAYASDRDRARGAASIRAENPDVYILDDGFQHRRIARQLDLVLIDATRPFGYGYLLPRGLLREPVRALRRAHAIVLTRCDQVAETRLAEIERALLQETNAPILHTRHAVTAVETLEGSPITDGLRGRRVALVSAIGNPEAFRSTVASLGADVAGEMRRSDHYDYQSSDLEGLLRAPKFASCEWFVTTEKDAVKLKRFQHPVLERTAVVRIAIEFLRNDAKVLDDLLQFCLSRAGRR